MRVVPALRGRASPVGESVTWPPPRSASRAAELPLRLWLHSLEVSCSPPAVSTQAVLARSPAASQVAPL